MPKPIRVVINAKHKRVEDLQATLRLHILGLQQHAGWLQGQLERPWVSVTTLAEQREAMKRIREDVALIRVALKLLPILHTQLDQLNEKKAKGVTAL